jgi:catechol 2,3-dioxygenase-like lactoylglutathione lyase family enzyme
MSEIKLGAIGQIALHVTDIDRSVEFYGDTLGMKKIFDAPNLTFFDNGGARLMLSSREGSVIYYTVDDIQNAHRELTSAGVLFNADPHVLHSSENYELWMAFFKDPDGNQLAIMDERGALG